MKPKNSKKNPSTALKIVVVVPDLDIQDL